MNFSPDYGGRRARSQFPCLKRGQARRKKKEEELNKLTNTGREK